jgi:pimeloyl-ACP methyl ester carboxylesterase
VIGEPAIGRFVTEEESAMTGTNRDGGAAASRGTDLRIEQRGEGPDVLLIAGLSDPAEAWQLQLDGLADRYRLTAFDNRGAGRSPLPDGDFTVATMAEDAVSVLDTTGVERPHVAGFSGGSAIAQELALCHPERVRSLVLMSTYARPDAYFRAATDAWRWLVESPPSERAALETFFLWIYTARAHEDGTVAQIVDEALAYPYPQPPEAFQAQLDAFVGHDTYDRLPQITVPTLVLAGSADLITPPRYGRIVAERIPGARFEVMEGEAHQPFQEVPDVFNARVDAFWQEVEAAGATH